jgi:uncharacterized protein YkwD
VGQTFMLRAFFASLAILVASGAGPATVPKPRPANYRPVAPPQLPSSVSYDAEAERQLLALANQVRAQAGVPPLLADDGLTQAARQHAAAMAAQRQLSHQFPGEPSLAQRLAASTNLHLNRTGENVASAASVELAQEGLMLSPPHRQNLLNPAYNVAGFGVIRSGASLYVTQDFGQALATYSTQESDDRVAAGVILMRSDAKLPQLQREDSGAARACACSMAQADSLNTTAPQAHYVVRYTSMQLGGLPKDVPKIIRDRRVQAFAVGTCYAHGLKYPNGVYWVVLLFY